MLQTLSGLTCVFTLFALILSITGEYDEYGLTGYGREKDGKYDMDAYQKACNKWPGGISIEKSCTNDRDGIISCENTGNLTIKECPKGTECGKCKVSWFWYGSDCHCLRKLSQPFVTFPSSGTISWNGIIRHQKWKAWKWKGKNLIGIYDTTEFKVEGEISRTTDGAYLLRTVHYGSSSPYPGASKKESTTMIFPNAESTMFLEYKGDGRGKCVRSSTSTDNRRGLTWIWEYFTAPESYNTWYLDNTKGTMQKWKNTAKHAFDPFCRFACDAGNDDNRYLFLTAQVVDEENDIVVPKMLSRKRHLGLYDQWKTTVQFSYREEGEEIFSLATYCDNNQD